MTVSTREQQTTVFCSDIVNESSVRLDISLLMSARSHQLFTIHTSCAVSLGLRRIMSWPDCRPKDKNSETSCRTFIDGIRSAATQRDRATRYVSWNIVNCCTPIRKITFEKLAVGNNLEWDSRSSELPLCDRSYHFRLVVCSNNDSVWHRFQHLQCTWVSAELRLNKARGNIWPRPQRLVARLT